MEKSQCESCRRWFDPAPSKRKKQRFCLRKRCRRASHRLACQAYRRANPDDDKSRRAKIRTWARKKGYWFAWRAEHPDYREREKARMRKNREGVIRVAKRDLRKRVFLDELRVIQAQMPETVAKRDLRDRRVDALLSCLIRNESSQNEMHTSVAVISTQ